MNKQRAKLFAAVLTISAMPLALSGACNPFTGYLSIDRYDYHDAYFYDDYYYDDYFFYEDDCFFFDCGYW